jgi:hypothetical protein
MGTQIDQKIKGNTVLLGDRGDLSTHSLPEDLDLQLLKRAKYSDNELDALQRTRDDLCPRPGRTTTRLVHGREYSGDEPPGW